MNQREARRLWSFVWRFGALLLTVFVIFVLPVAYVLFAPAPFDPLASLAAWRFDHMAWRLGGVAALVALLSSMIGLWASRESARNPFSDLASLINRIGTGDFRVRVEPYSAHEPHELTQIREALNGMAAELERAEEQRNNLIADVSHELRTPLTALEGNLRAALDRVYPLDEAGIANLYGQTRHLIRLVNDLHQLALADARQLPLHAQPTNVAALLDETLALFAPLAEENGVELRNTFASLPTATLDVMRIRQVLHNLLTNALRHTPAGGVITVTSATDGDTLVLAIADTGDGLETEHLDAIFNRFYRTDKSRSRDTGGTGLGLAIASALVAAHGGTLTAASPGVGTGSTFTIRLPLTNTRNTISPLVVR